jgi:hypothetical protein
MKITEEQYNNLSSMLLAKDTESNSSAITIIENIDFEENRLYLLLLLKKTNWNFSKLEKKSPKIAGYLTSIDRDLLDNLTYNRILNYLISSEPKIEEIEFFVKELNNFLLESIKEGFPFIKSINVTIEHESK